MLTSFVLAFLLVAVALLVVLIPEIRERMPRRRARNEDHYLRQDPNAPPPPPRPDLKREDREAEV